MTRNDRISVTRRDAVKGAAVGAVAAGLGAFASREAAAQEAFDAIVIGTGFGGTVATIALSAHGKKTLVIERGTFWVTPETLGAPTAPSNEVSDFDNRNKMRVQFWSRPDHGLGILDLLANRYHDANPYGLHNYRMFRHAHILTASGVGGGSLIYSNVNLQARPAVLDRIGLKGIDYNRTQKFMEKFRGKFNNVVTKNPQVTLSPESEVRTIKRVGDAYEVTYIDRRGENNSEGQTKTVRASQVFLAAGVLGTTEILLRSRNAGLALSDKLGLGFSTNGDFGALAVGTKMIGADGQPVRRPDGTAAKASVYPTRGPIKTAAVRFEIDGRHYTIKDCGIPSMFALVVRTGFDGRAAVLAL